MFLSEVVNIIKSPISVIRDCYFERCYLVGKEIESIPVISYINDLSYLKALLSTNIEGVICTEEIKDTISKVFDGGIIVTDNPKTAFFEIHNYIAEMNKKDDPVCISESAVIHNSAIIGEKNIKIGKNTIICANAIIKEDVVIGDNCIIMEGCIVGAPAFYNFGEGENCKLVRSAGGVIIGNNVDLHCNTTIEKGALFGNTYIGDNTKIDNKCLIGHDSRIGDNCTIAAGTTFAGGVKFGTSSFAGVGVTIAPNVKVGMNCKLSAGSVVTKDISSGIHASGNFAIPHDAYVEHIKNINTK